MRIRRHVIGYIDCMTCGARFGMKSEHPTSKIIVNGEEVPCPHVGKKMHGFTESFDPADIWWMLAIEG